MPTPARGDFSSRQWPDWSFWRDGLGRGSISRGRGIGVAVNSLALVALVPLVTELVDGRYGAPVTGVGLGVIACYAVGYLLGIWFGPVSSRRRRVAAVSVLCALGLTPAVLLGSPDYLTNMTYAIAVGLMLLPLRYSVLLGFATAVGQIGWMRVGYGRVEWVEAGTLIAVTTALGGFFALLYTIGHLRAAREQIKTLAVARERERVARDLHDILGHSLSTMTVKLGLTRRILESSADVAAAVEEIRELESLSRQALFDVRATVSDYRTVSLAAEIAGARAALAAAGVQAELPAAVDEVIPELQPVFGYVVREAVTNVLRHSGATRCRIQLGRDWVEITDNGTATPQAAAGHGLAGLTERLAAVSGTLDHGSRPDGGFRVLARGRVPATQPLPVPAPSREVGPA